MRTLVGLMLPLALVAAEPGIRGFSASAATKQRELEARARAVPDPQRLREYMRRMSEEPHHAGSAASRAVAEWARDLIRGWGLDARIEEFEAMLPVPKLRELEMIEPVRFTAKLREPVIPEDRDSGDGNQLPTYNAYAASGEVTAPVVYVNYGVPEDYQQLKKLGIEVKGKIVLARYGGSWRGVKPKVAWENGAVACLIYSDPHEDGYFAGDVYPKGPYRPRDGGQRGSVMDMAVYPGDPLSPGWASEKGSKRLTREEATTLTKIPVLPISWSDALPLLENLGGPVAPAAWRGALPITYHLGPGPTQAHLKLELDYPTGPLHNVIVRIPGAEYPDQWVMYGNHHDAWVNGAADPVSGASSLLETVRAFAELVKTGWRPKRTILFQIWDGEEFGLLGSTEWVEKHGDELDRKAVVYLNSDMNGAGNFSAGGSASLEPFITEVVRDIDEPVKKVSLLDHLRQPETSGGKPREFHLAALGSGSDYTAFFQHQGVASVNMGFGDSGAAGVYHSIYDSFDWYTRYSDKNFVYGRALSQFSVTALLRMAEAPVLPFEFTHWAATAEGYLSEVKKLGDGKLKLDAAARELAELSRAARGCEQRYQKAVDRAAGADSARLAALNERLYRTERALLLSEGLPGRPWFRHALSAPGMYTGYAAKTLPGIREAAEAGRWDEAYRQTEAVTQIFRGLRRELEGIEKALAGI